MTELTKGNLTEGSITGTMLRFAWPLMLGNLLQQCYNIADTLMIFITSIFIGLCMGCSAVFSMQYGAGDLKALRQSIRSAVWVTTAFSLAVFM